MKTSRQLIFEVQLDNSRQAYIQRIAQAGDHPHLFYSKTAEDYAVRGLKAPGYIAHEVVCRICGINIDHQHLQQTFIQEVKNGGI